MGPYQQLKIFEHFFSHEKNKNSNQGLTAATLDLIYDFEMCFETYHGSEI